jgi:hypothetical protein
VADVVGRAVLEIVGDSTKYFGEAAKVKADAKALGAAFAELPKALAPLPAALTGSATAAAQLAANFRGDKIIQQAHDITTAIEQLKGNFSTLSSGQVTQSIGTLEQAMKMVAARGYEIPPAMRQAADSLKLIQKESTGTQASLGGAASKIGGFVSSLGIGLPLSLGAAAAGLVTFGKSALENAGHLVDLNAKTTVSMDGLQRMAFVAKQSGATVDDYTDSIFKLGVNVHKGGAETQEAVAKMGLSFQQFKAQAPEQQFNTIIENLDKLGTGGERNAALVALFGKGVAGTVAGMVDNYKKLARQAVVASDEQIHALDDASDAWDRFVKNTESRITQLLGSFVLLAADSKKHLQTQIQYLQLAANGMVPYINGVAGARAELEQMRAGMPELFAHWKQDIDITDTASASQRSLTEELRAAQEALAGLSVEQRAQVEAGLELGRSTEKIAADTGVSAEVIELYKKALQEAKTETERFTTANAKYQDSLARMNELVDGTGMSTGEWARQLLFAHASLDDVQTVTGMTAGAVRDLGKAVAGEMDLEKTWAELNMKMHAAVLKDWDTFIAQQVKLADQKAAAIIKNLQAEDKAVKDTVQNELTLRIRSIDAQIAAEKRRGASVDQILQLELQKENLAYRQRLNQIEQEGTARQNALTKGVKGYDDAYNAIADDVRVQMAAAAVDHRAAVDGMVADAKRLRVSWMDAVGAISGSLSGIGGNAGGFLASISKIESSFKSLDEAASRFSAKGGGTAANFAALGTSFASIATALVAVGLQLWNVYEAEQKADAETRAYEQSQADLGVTLSGPTITAIQASQKAFLALYTGMITGNKVFNDLLATLGGKVTPAFQAQIGEAMNLTAVIKDLGGVSAANVGKIEQLAGVTLKLTGMGGATGAQAMQELSGALQELGTYAEKTGGLWDAAFKKLIADAAAAGVGIDTINSLISGQQSKLASGIAGVTGALGKDAAAWENRNKAVDEAQNALDDFVSSGKLEKARDALQKATEGGDPTKIKAATYALAAAQEQLRDLGNALADSQDKARVGVVHTQEEFDRLSRIALNTFATMVASGKTPVEAMQAIGASVDDLINGNRAFELSGNAAFEELQQWRELTKNNEPLLTSIGSLNDLLTATTNLSGINKAAFADFEAQGVSAYDKLIAAGFTQQQAEKELAPLLQNIVQIAKDKNLAIDEGTQKLIDQAKADGELQDQQETQQQVMKEGLGEIIKLLGGDLPAAWDKTAKAGKDAADKMTGKDGLGGVDAKLKDPTAWEIWRKEAETQSALAAKAIKANMPDSIDIAVNFDPGSFTPPPGVQTFGGGAEVPPVVPMADGWAGRVLGPTMFLAGEKPGGEDVMFSGAGKHFASGGGNTINVYNPIVRGEGDIIRMRNELGKMLRQDL